MYGKLKIITKYILDTTTGILISTQEQVEVETMITRIVVKGNKPQEQSIKPTHAKWTCADEGKIWDESTGLCECKVKARGKNIGVDSGLAIYQLLEVYH